MRHVYVRPILLAVLYSAACLAQNQQEPATARDFCVKVPHGKNLEFENYLHNISVPLNQGRADAGEITWWGASRAVVPMGTSAPCDYRLVFGYKGLPPEPTTPAQTEAALKRAKLSVTVPDLYAKRDALSTLVGVDIWYTIDAVGPRTEKGAYVRLNHYKTKPGQMDAWQKLEAGYWKKIVEADLKAGGKGSWTVLGLMAPAGDVIPYDGMTVDIFPDWASLMRGVPAGDLWPKVHTDMNVDAYLNRLDQVRTIHDRDVYQVIELVRAK